MADESVDLRHFETTLEPVYTQLMNKLKAFAPDASLSLLNESAEPLVTPTALRQLGLPLLVRDLGITGRPDSSFPHLVHLTHDLSSPLTERVARECSGLVVDSSRNWQVVSMPFPKMFSTTSTADDSIASIDFASASISEMLDGVLVCLYWLEDASQWRVSTKFTSDGSESLGAVNLTKFADWSNFVSQQTAHFSAIHPNKGRIQILPGDSAKGTVREAFWRLWAEQKWRLPDDDQAKRRCYMFELCTPLQINIVEHQSENLLLTGCRSLDTLEELEAALIAARFGWRPVRRIANSVFGDSISVKSLEVAVRRLDPIVHAGYVVVDKHWRRLQIRSAGFHALEKLHPMNDANMNKKFMMDLVRTNQSRSWTKLAKYRSAGSFRNRPLT